MSCTDCKVNGICQDAFTDVSQFCNGSKPKPLTNADRLRAMTDKELARFMAHYDSITEVGEQLAYERWLDWLRQEAPDV